MTNTKLLDKTYEKIYVLDTNIILNESSNIELLSQDGNNLIVLPETVLDEIDAKKSGHDEINYQARQFQRQLQDAIITDNVKIENLNFINVKINEESTIDLHLIAKDGYDVDKLDIDKKIINDRKILEIAADVKKMYAHDTVIFVSLDIMARTRAISLGIDAETLKLDTDLDNHTISFHCELEIEGFNGDITLIPECEDHISNIEVTNPITGNRYYYFRTVNSWGLIDDKNINRDPSVPRNVGQKAMSDLILDDTNDIIVVSGPAGTGKNYVSLGAATRLMDLHKDKYEKIIYIRKTIIAGNKDDELGFLPGSLEEKMNGYIQPMENSIENLVKNKAKKKLHQDEVDEKVQEFKDRYQVQYVYSAHLRGQTFDKGSIIILDESQNWDRSTMKTIISRSGEDTLFLIMGSNNQIDAPYLGKSNNALTFMMNQCGKPNESGIRIQGINLTNVVRSKIAEWADIAFDRD